MDKQIKRIRKALNLLIDKLEQKAIEEGTDITTKEWSDLIYKLKKAFLAEKGIDLAEYEEALAKPETARKLINSLVDKPDIPSEAQIAEIAERVASQLLSQFKPEIPEPKIINKIVRSVVKEKPIIKREIVKEIVVDNSKLDKLNKDLKELQISHTDLIVNTEKEIKVSKDFMAGFDGNFEGKVTELVAPELNRVVRSLQSQIYMVDVKVDAFEKAENLWDRTGTTIEPHTANDNLDMGSGTITTTGQITVPLIETAGTTDILDIQPDATGTGVSVELFKNATTAGNKPKLKLHGYADSYGTPHYVEMYIDNYQRFVMGGTYNTAYFETGVSIPNNAHLSLGGSPYSRLTGSNTQDPAATVWGLRKYSTTINPILLLVDYSDLAYNFAHPQQDNPTLFIHSTAQSTTEWLGLTHDGTSGLITSGTGEISFDNENIATTGSITAGNGVIGTLNIGGSGWYDDGTYLSPLGTRNLYVRSTTPVSSIWSPTIYLGGSSGSTINTRANTIAGNAYTFSSSGIFSNAYGVKDNQFEYSVNALGSTTKSLLPLMMDLYSDAFVFRPIAAIEYWDGGAWVDWSGTESGQGVIDGRSDTGINATMAYAKYRITIQTQGWLAAGMLFFEREWTSATSPGTSGAKGFDYIIEDSATAGGTYTNIASGTFDTYSAGGRNSMVMVSRHHGNAYWRITIDASATVDEATEEILIRNIKLFCSGNLARGTFRGNPWSTSYDKTVTFGGNITTTSNIYNKLDNAKHYFGAGNDASIYYDGTDLHIDSQEVGSGHIILDSPKTTTGDPTGVEGKIYWNTVDNVIKMYADGNWRTLSSW